MARELSKPQTVGEVVKTFLRYDPLFHHAHIPHARGYYRSPVGEFETEILMNSHGMRDHEFSVERPTGVSRLLVLGDSVAEGAQVSLEETFPKCLETVLNRVRPGRWQVLNASVSSYSPAPEYLYLKERGVLFDPQWVVVVFSFNDVTDDHQYYKTAILDEEGLPVKLPADEEALQTATHSTEITNGTPMRTAVNNYLRERLRTYRSLAEGYHRFQMRRGTVAFGGIAPPRGYRPENPLTENPFAIFKETLSEEEEDAWQLSERLLASIGRLCRARRTKFLLVIAPPGNQVDKEQWKVGKKWWGFSHEDVITSTAMQRRLIALGKREGFAVLDLLPFLRQEAQAAKLYFDFDGHWTARGHLKVAEFIYQALRKSGMEE